MKTVSNFARYTNGQSVLYVAIMFRWDKIHSKILLINI